MLIGIINNKIESLIFKDIQHKLSVEVRRTFMKCEEDHDVMSAENQQDALEQVAVRVETAVRKEYNEPVNARLLAFLIQYTQLLCSVMRDKVVSIDNVSNPLCGWDRIADYFLLNMYGEANKVEARIAAIRADAENKQEDNNNDAE